MQSLILKIVLCCSALLSSISSGYATPPNANFVVDAEASWKFASVGDSFELNGFKLLCVQTRAALWAVWDPLKNILLPDSGNSRRCIAPHGSRRLHDTVDVSASSPSLVGADARFGDDASISSQLDNSSNCGTIFAMSYSTRREIEDYSFYIINTLKKPHQLNNSGRSCAEGSEAPKRPYYQRFDSAFTLRSLTLTDGKTLLVSTNNEATEPIVLIVHGYPTKIFRAGNSYFVPAIVLKPRLVTAGDDIVKRQRAFEQLIGSKL